MFGLLRSERSEGRISLNAQIRCELLEDRVVPATLIDQNFDTVRPPALPNGWQTQVLQGSNAGWKTQANSAAPTLPNVAAATYPATGETGALDTVLVSPVVQIPAAITGNPNQLVQTGQLSFLTNYSFGAGGGTLEVSVNGSAFVNVVNAGATFTAGGYNGMITAGNVAGEQGWIKTSGGFVRQTVDLANVVHAGDSVQFRWRFTQSVTATAELAQAIDSVRFVVTVNNIAAGQSPNFNANPNARYAVASAGGTSGSSTVLVYNGERQIVTSLTPFPGYHGPLTVATGDVTGDGIEDVAVAPGSGSNVLPVVIIYNGATGLPVRAFFANPVTTGINVALGDVSGKGYDDIITAPAGRNALPFVNVYDGQSGLLVRSILAYPPGTNMAGVSVASADINGDGKADIITGSGAGGPAVVEAFDGATGAPFLSFLPYTSGYTGGVNVAAGDLSGNGLADIVTAPATGFSLIRVFSGASRQFIESYLAYPAVLSQGGARIAVTDVAGTKNEEVLVSGGSVPGFGTPAIEHFTSTGSLFDYFFPFEGAFLGGANVG